MADERASSRLDGPALTDRFARAIRRWPWCQDRRGATALVPRIHALVDVVPPFAYPREHVQAMDARIDCDRRSWRALSSASERPGLASLATVRFRQREDESGAPRHLEVLARVRHKPPVGSDAIAHALRVISNVNTTHEILIY
jgi:hypothetical protein